MKNIKLKFLTSTFISVLAVSFSSSATTYSNNSTKADTKNNSTNFSSESSQKNGNNII